VKVEEWRKSSKAYHSLENREMYVYMGREIDPILSRNKESAAWLSWEERRLEEKPELLVDALSIQRGMKIVDARARTRFITVQLGCRRLVFTSDLQSQMFYSIGQIFLPMSSSFCLHSLILISRRPPVILYCISWCLSWSFKCRMSKGGSSCAW
jgi:hypothetical protein